MSTASQRITLENLNLFVNSKQPITKVLMDHRVALSKDAPYDVSYGVTIDSLCELNDFECGIQHAICISCQRNLDDYSVERYYTFLVLSKNGFTFFVKTTKKYCARKKNPIRPYLSELTIQHVSTERDTPIISVYPEYEKEEISKVFPELLKGHGDCMVRTLNEVVGVDNPLYGRTCDGNLDKAVKREKGNSIARFVQYFANSLELMVVFCSDNEIDFCYRLNRADWDGSWDTNRSVCDTQWIAEK